MRANVWRIDRWNSFCPASTEPFIKTIKTIMEKIKSITEAYSMQPCSIQVETQDKYDSYKNREFAETFCKEIKVEQVTIGDPSTGTVFMAYVGYSFSGQKLFQYLVDSVNVHYEAV